MPTLLDADRNSVKREVDAGQPDISNVDQIACLLTLFKEPDVRAAGKGSFEGEALAS